MTKRYVAIAAILIITLTGLSGCGETTNFLGGTPEEEIKTVRSDEVYIPIEKIRTLNPIITRDEDAYYVGKLIYEGLFGFDNNLALTGILAESYTYGEDGDCVTVNLKRGVLWQDGRELTSEDVKFTMDVIASASYTGSTLYAGNISNVKSVRLDSNDPHQITIFFTNPQNISISNLTFPIIPKHQFKNMDAAKKPDAGFIPIGTGAYKVSEYNELSHIILSGNESYHGGSHPANQLNFQVIPNKRDAVNLMDLNNISVTFSKEIDRDTIYTNKEVNVTNFASNEVELIGFNFRNSALKDERVRKAIAGVIDTAEIIESSYYKNGTENDTIFFPGFLGISGIKNNHTLDVTGAKQLLREAGYFDRDGDGRLENAAGQVLSFTILVNSEDQSRLAAAQLIKEGLDQLPIQTAIVSKDWESYNADLTSGSFDIYLGGYRIKENYDLRFLLHTNYGNVIGYSNPALDILLDKMESGISQKDREYTFSQIKDILNKELPYYCLLYKTYGAIASPSLKGEIRPSFLDLYHGADKWYSLIEVPNEQSDEPETETDSY